MKICNAHSLGRGRPAGPSRVLNAHLLRNRRRWRLHTNATPAINDTEIDFDAIYGGGSLPLRWVGPVEVQDIPDKGRGVVATRHIPAGHLILVTQPLLYLTSEGQDEVIPDIQRLLEKLNAETFTQHQLAWMRALHAGDAHAAPQPVPSLHGGPKDAATASRRGLQEDDVEEALRLNVLALNMFGEAFQDLPASLVRGDTPVGHVGLWPEFSLLNHSCAPNAVNYTVGDRMVVRAAKDVKQGEEVCINYLGRGGLRPATERLLDLREGYDFACACPRCAAELDTPHDAAVGAAQALHDAVMLDLLPSLQAALGGQGAEAISPAGAIRLVASTRAQLAPLLQSLETALRGVAEAPSAPGQPAAGGPQLAAWLRASAFEAYNLASQLDDISAQLEAGREAREGQQTAAEDAALLPESPAEQQMLGVVASVCPGSDLHMFLAVKALSRAQQAHGAGSSTALGAQQSAVQALQLRYGPGLSDVTLARLLKAASVTLDRVAL